MRGSRMRDRKPPSLPWGLRSPPGLIPHGPGDPDGALSLHSSSELTGYCELRGSANYPVLLWRSLVAPPTPAASPVARPAQPARLGTPLPDPRRARPQSGRLHRDTAYCDCRYHSTQLHLRVLLLLNRGTARWRPLMPTGRPARLPVLSPYCTIPGFRTLRPCRPANFCTARTSVPLPASSCLAGTADLVYERNTNHGARQCLLRRAQIFPCRPGR